MTWALALLVALLSPTPGHAADDAVTVVARVSPEKSTIGTPFRYELVVSGPEGIEVHATQPAERIGPFDIVDFGTEPPQVTDDSRVAYARWWALVAWTPGSYTIDSPPLRYRLPGEDLQPVDPVETTVEIASVLAADAEAIDIKDIKPPRPLPADLRPYYALAALAAILMVALLASRWVASRTRRRPVALPKPPHQVAIEALEALRGRHLPEQGSFKDFYSALSGIVRVYLEARFGLRAPEMTTEEFLAATARDFQLAIPHRRLLGEFLAESDLVKFARHHPTISDSENAYAAARRFVDETADLSLEANRAVG
jgi:hypothetical protein